MHGFVIRDDELVSSDKKRQSICAVERVAYNHASDNINVEAGARIREKGQD